MVGTYNDEREGNHLDQALLDDMLSDDNAGDGDALIPVLGNITVDSAFAGEIISRHANTMVIRLLEYTKMQAHDAIVAIAKHTAWHPTAGYSQDLTVARTTRLTPGAKLAFCHEQITIQVLALSFQNSTKTIDFRPHRSMRLSLSHLSNYTEK